MNLETTQQIGIEMRKIDAKIQHANNAGLLIAMESNFRSYSWHDLLTNRRGRMNIGRTSHEQTDVHNERREPLNYIQEQPWNQEY